MPGMRIIAPAKLNLGLLVKEKRADGYHNIETILVPVNLFDQLEIYPLKRKTIKIITSHKDIPSDKRNLVYKAAEVFLAAYKKRIGVKIVIKKEIPVGKGLGGGSSDAGATLYGLNLLFSKPFSDQELLRMGSEIGMDVPFFIKCKPAYATGRGEVLEDISIPKLYFLLYIPKIAISSAWAYRHIVLTKSNFSLKILVDKLKEKKIKEIYKYLRNDFESLVFKCYPSLKRVRDKLDKMGYKTFLTGTGSALYIVLKDKEEQRVAKEEFKKRGEEFISVESLTRSRRVIDFWGVV